MDLSTAFGSSRDSRLSSSSSRQPRLLRQMRQHVGSDGGFQLVVRQFFDWGRGDPRVRYVALAISFEALEQFAEAAVQQSADAASGAQSAETAQQTTSPPARPPPEPPPGWPDDRQPGRSSRSSAAYLDFDIRRLREDPATPSWMESHEPCIYFPHRTTGRERRSSRKVPRVQQIGRDHVVFFLISMRIVTVPIWRSNSRT